MLLEGGGVVKQMDLCRRAEEWIGSRANTSVAGRLEGPRSNPLRELVLDYQFQRSR